jgi:hypothetical protein
LPPHGCAAVGAFDPHAAPAPGAADEADGENVTGSEEIARGFANGMMLFGGGVGALVRAPRCEGATPFMLELAGAGRDVGAPDRPACGADIALTGDLVPAGGGTVPRGRGAFAIGAAATGFPDEEIELMMRGSTRVICVSASLTSPGRGIFGSCATFGRESRCFIGVVAFCKWMSSARAVQLRDHDGVCTFHTGNHTHRLGGTTGRDYVADRIAIHRNSNEDTHAAHECSRHRSC